MTQQSSHPHRRDFAASDGFASLHSATPHPHARASISCFDGSSLWRSTPVAPRRSGLISGVLRRLPEHRRPVASENP